MVQVWNVVEGQAVANYQVMPGSLSWFVTWSPVSPDFIISGMVYLKLAPFLKIIQSFK